MASTNHYSNHFKRKFTVGKLFRLGATSRQQLPSATTNSVSNTLLLVDGQNTIRVEAAKEDDGAERSKDDADVKIIGFSRASEATVPWTKSRRRTLRLTFAIPWRHQKEDQCEQTPTVEKIGKRVSYKRTNRHG